MYHTNFVPGYYLRVLSRALNAILVELCEFVCLLTS